ncbi:McrB family protein [Rothia nasimurium]|uniref:McrB family protein n=1 Tax=Rothia nasimurium TaxID=85336 RepID=UPI0016298366|nr:AAA family ATPase [Rothia nasimurium]
MFGVLILGNIENVENLKDIKLSKDNHSIRFLRVPKGEEGFQSGILNDFHFWKNKLEEIPVFVTSEFKVEEDFSWVPNDSSGRQNLMIESSAMDNRVYVGNIVIKEYDLESHSFLIDFEKNANYDLLRLSDISYSYYDLFDNFLGKLWFHHTHFSIYNKSIDDFLKKFEISSTFHINGPLRDLEDKLNIIVDGVAGSGKSHMLQELRTSKSYGDNGSRIEVVVFHPSTSYEEFVSGIRPNFSKQAGESDFVTQEGTFVQMCNRAAQDPDNAYLLFIDEINRANTARVFGDLMLVLEKSKRQEFKDLAEEGRDGALFESSVQEMPGEYVRLQTPIFKNGKEYNKLAVPTNLHVLGTMNTTDRSVGTIDLALRRRFHWVTQHPFTAEELQEAMEENGEDYPEDIASWYENANTILLNQVGPDARLGHAYFFGKDGDAEAIAEALLNQLKEVAFTFNISQTILDAIGPVHGQKIITRGTGLGARPDIVDESYQG